MKFVISYSGGKDSVLSLHKMLEAGNDPIGLLVMINRNMQRSWFHGVDIHMLKQISSSLEIPLIMCESAGEDYHTALEDGLKRAKQAGAEACAFGDIDIEGHREWCIQRCEAVGLKCIHPLWHKDREENTKEIISLGYQCLIKCIKNEALSKDFLGKVLDFAVVEQMKKRNIDICGENGEYHTVVVDGPIFKHPISYECKEILDFGNISAINICTSMESFV